MISALCKTLLLVSCAQLATAGGRNADFKDLGLCHISTVASVVASGPIDKPNHHHIFFRNAENNLAVRSVAIDCEARTERWHDIVNLQGGICSDPGATRYPGGVISFVFGMNNNMYSKYKNDNGGWTDYQHHGGVCYGTPAATWIGCVHAFVRGTDNGCWVRWGTPGGGWGGFGSFGGTFVSNPTAAGYQPQRGQIRGLVAQVGTDNKVYTRIWNGGAWADWSCLEGKSAGDPVLVGSSPRPEWNAYGGVELYIRTIDGQLIRRCFDGDIWQDWDAMPFKLWRPFTAVCGHNGTHFYSTKEGRVHLHTYALPQ